MRQSAVDVPMDTLMRTQNSFDIVRDIPGCDGDHAGFSVGIFLISAANLRSARQVS